MCVGGFVSSSLSTLFPCVGNNLKNQYVGAFGNTPLGAAWLKSPADVLVQIIQCFPHVVVVVGSEEHSKEQYCCVLSRQVEVFSDRNRLKTKIDNNEKMSPTHRSIRSRLQMWMDELLFHVTTSELF